LVITNCRWRDCGPLWIKPARDTATVTFEDNEITDNISTINFSIVFTSPAGGGAFTVKRNVFHNSREPIWDGCTDWIVENNYFHESPTSVSGTNFLFKDNYCRHTDVGGAGFFRSTATNNYFCSDQAQTNYGVVYTYAYEEDTLFSGNICDSTSLSQKEEADYIGANAQAGYAVTISNNILLPLPFGHCGGKMYSDHRSVDATCLVDLLHNTCITTTYEKRANPLQEIETGMGVGENTQTSETVRAMKSNLFWSPDDISGGYMLARNQGSTVQDFVLATNCTHNWGYNLSPGSEEPTLGVDGFNCYDTATAMFSTGVPDIAGTTDPMFVDTTRNLATFDTASLGNAVAPVWVTGTSYVVGNVVSTTNADFYGGTAINFRCKSDHTAGALTEPGVGADWYDEWELQSAYRLREDVTRIIDLVTWVKAGFVVNNSDLEDAGHDGVTIGAMGFVSLNVDCVAKSDATANQKEGSQVVGVTKQGDVLTHGGRDVPDSQGVDLMNERWGQQFLSE
jgi:hypothetical protein